LHFALLGSLTQEGLAARCRTSIPICAGPYYVFQHSDKFNAR
jgi:hypothetical protein